MKRTIPSETDYSVIRFETELLLQQAPARLYDRLNSVNIQVLKVPPFSLSPIFSPFALGECSNYWETISLASSRGQSAAGSGKAAALQVARGSPELHDVPKINGSI